MVRDVGEGVGFGMISYPSSFPFRIIFYLSLRAVLGAAISRLLREYPRNDGVENILQGEANAQYGECFY